MILRRSVRVQSRQQPSVNRLKRDIASPRVGLPSHPRLSIQCRKTIESQGVYVHQATNSTQSRLGNMIQQYGDHTGSNIICPSSRLTEITPPTPPRPPPFSVGGASDHTSTSFPPLQADLVGRTACDNLTSSPRPPNRTTLQHLSIPIRLRSAWSGRALALSGCTFPPPQ